MRSTGARRLVCPACGDLLGDAIHRRWPGSLTIRAEAGHIINPTSAVIRTMTTAQGEWAVVE